MSFKEQRTARFVAEVYEIARTLEMDRSAPAPLPRFSAELLSGDRVLRVETVFKIRHTSVDSANVRVTFFAVSDGKLITKMRVLDHDLDANGPEGQMIWEVIKHRPMVATGADIYSDCPIRWGSAYTLQGERRR